MLNLYKISNLPQGVKKQFSYISLIWNQNVLRTSKSGSVGVHLSTIMRPPKNCLRNMRFYSTYLFIFPQILQKEQQIKTINQVLN